MSSPVRSARGPVWLFQSEADLPRSDGWLSALEADRAGRMRFAKRRNDFLLGRWTAKLALARQLGRSEAPGELSQLEVRNARGGAPEAYAQGRPAGLALSLTDRAGWAVCALAPPEVSIGCDLELIEPRSDVFVSDYLTPAEREAVESAECSQRRDELANLLWCAKESALKVLRTGLRRDTRSVEVSFPGGASAGWSPLSIRAEEGGRMPGWWRRFGVFVLCVSADREIPAPRAILDPERLERGEPSHSWLAAPRVKVSPARPGP